MAKVKLLSTTSQFTCTTPITPDFCAFVDGSPAVSYVTSRDTSLIQLNQPPKKGQVLHVVRR